MIIREKESDARQEILDFLEEQGYVKDETDPRTKEEMVESILPIVIDKAGKKYSMMGNITCAAAAVSSGVPMLSKAEFYAEFDGKT